MGVEDSINIIDSIDKLRSLFSLGKQVNLYGAGVRLYLFFQMIDACKMNIEADRILVSSAKGNPRQIRGITVVEYSQELLTKEDIVLLTLSECYVDEVKELLADTKAAIYKIDFDIVDAFPSNEIKASITPYK